MPLVYQQNINGDAKVGVWHITESEEFFLETYSPSIQIKNTQKRIQHLAGRYLLKLLNGSISFHDILISAKGMPYMKDGSCFFSISHCDDYVAVIINKSRKTGIDIESVKPKIGLIKHKFLTEQELNLLQSTNLDSLNQYTIGWTIKETMFKWFGEGNVDFRKNLIIKSFESKGDELLFDTIFSKDDESLALRIKTIMLQQKIMSWIA